MPFAHRLAASADLARIVEIYNAAIPSQRATADTEPVSLESRLTWFADHTPDFRPLWVAEVEGCIAAWLSFSSFYGRPAYSKTAEISVYVDASCRGRGLGSYLLTQAIAHAPSIRLDTLLGFIFGHNGPSLRLFEKHGFRRWGELPRVASLDGVERDLVIVGRRV